MVSFAHDFTPVKRHLDIFGRGVFRRQAGFDGVDQRHPRVIARAHRLAACRHHHRLRHFAQRIGRGVGAKALVVLEPGDRRIGEEFEIVVGQAARAGG